MLPAVVIRPILLALSVFSVSDLLNQSAPSGPTVNMEGCLATANSVTAPAVVIRPILSPWISANHSAPSGPVTMSKGAPPTVGTENSLITPAVVIRPILSAPASANHKAPRPGRNPVHERAGGWNRELGDRAGDGDAPDLVAADLGEPQRVIRPGRNAAGTAGHDELGEEAGRRNSPDPVAVDLGEPNGSSRPRREMNGPSLGVGSRNSRMRARPPRAPVRSDHRRRQHDPGRGFQTSTQARGKIPYLRRPLVAGSARPRGSACAPV